MLIKIYRKAYRRCTACAYIKAVYFLELNPPTIDLLGDPCYDLCESCQKPLKIAYVPFAADIRTIKRVLNTLCFKQGYFIPV